MGGKGNGGMMSEAGGVWMWRTTIREREGQFDPWANRQNSKKMASLACFWLAKSAGCLAAFFNFFCPLCHFPIRDDPPFSILFAFSVRCVLLLHAKSSLFSMLIFGGTTDNIQAPMSIINNCDAK